MMIIMRVASSWLMLTGIAFAQQPAGPLAERLAKVKFVRYAEAPGYSEGPTYRNGEVYFCSGALMRVDAQQRVSRYLEIGPAGTVLRRDGHLLVCDNKHKALLVVSPEGNVGVLAERADGQLLRSLNDLTVDARGNIYWTDPEGSTPKNPVGRIYRLRPDGRAEQIGAGLAFPNGLDVDPNNKYLYVIESQSKKILRYALPNDHEHLGKPEEFYDLGGSGGDGCAFDAEGNLWVADFHRPETGFGRITVLSPEGKVLAYLPVPAKVVSNIAFGGPKHDEIFCTTGDPPGVFHANVGVKGFVGHAAKTMPIVRSLNVVPLTVHADTPTLTAIARLAAEAKMVGGRWDESTKAELVRLSKTLTDMKHRQQMLTLLPDLEQAAIRYQQDRALIAEVKRLGGTTISEGFGPDWLRRVTSDETLAVYSRLTDIVLNERTDGHKEPTPKALTNRVTDDWLRRLAGQEQLRRLELSGTAITSDGLVHLKGLTNLEVLNVCLTAVDDRGLEHLKAMTKMRRMVVCSSKITGTGFKHLAGMTQLESVNLHSSPANDAGLEAIGAFKSLRRLEIVHTNVTDAGLKHVAKLVQLRQLHIASHAPTAKALPFLGELPELEQLDVYEQAASNETCAALAKLPKLRSLMLVTASMDDAGVKHLANVKTLEELTLNAPRVSDAAIDDLAQLTNLRKLSLAGTKMTPAARQRLAERLPKTTISP